MSTAELILFNANVITFDKHLPKARAVAIRGGKIMGIYPDKPPSETRGGTSQVIDCGNRTIVPGFHDAHCHIVALAESLVTLDLTPERVQSISDIKLKIRELSKKVEAGTWIRGWGYSEFDLAEKRHPNRWDLDEATTSHPIKLRHRSGHASVLNSFGLRLANISSETPDPPGGIIERDLETGEPTGLLYDMESYLARVIPPITEEQITRGIRQASELLLRKGVTSVQDASPRNDLQRWKLFQNWKASRLFKPRITMMLGFNMLEECHDWMSCQKIAMIHGCEWDH